MTLDESQGGQISYMTFLFMIFSTSAALIGSYSFIRITKRRDTFDVYYICCSLLISFSVLWLDNQLTLTYSVLFSYVAINVLASLANFLQDENTENRRRRGALVLLLLISQSLFFWIVSKDGFAHCKDFYFKLPIVVMKILVVFKVGFQMAKNEFKQMNAIIRYLILIQVVILLIWIDCQIADSYWPCLYYLIGLLLIFYDSEIESLFESHFKPLFLSFGHAQVKRDPRIAKIFYMKTKEWQISRTEYDNKPKKD